MGIFEQVRLADVFVHYDDVQFPQGRSFTTRVQIKTKNGIQWLSVPVSKSTSSNLISGALINEETNWRKKHLETIRHSYSKQPNFEAMFELVRGIYAVETRSLSALNISALETIADVMGFRTEFVKSSELASVGTSSERLIQICREIKADVYVTGHGARNYLKHSAFEERGIEVRYMEYRAEPWKQAHGEFTPYVSIIDLLASVPFSEAADYLKSETIAWSEFLARQ